MQLKKYMMNLYKPSYPNSNMTMVKWMFSKLSQPSNNNEPRRKVVSAFPGKSMDHYQRNSSEVGIALSLIHISEPTRPC